MDEVERIARLICQAQHADLLPDDKHVVREPGAPFEPLEAVPLWRLYEPAARALVEDQERRAEER